MLPLWALRGSSAWGGAAGQCGGHPNISADKIRGLGKPCAQSKESRICPDSMKGGTGPGARWGCQVKQGSQAQGWANLRAPQDVIRAAEMQMRVQGQLPLLGAFGWLSPKSLSRNGETREGSNKSIQDRSQRVPQSLSGIRPEDPTDTLRGQGHLSPGSKPLGILLFIHAMVCSGLGGLFCSSGCAVWPLGNC